MSSLCKLAAPAGRIMLCLIFLLSGIDKISNLAGTQQYMQSFGVPGILIYPTILVEVLGAAAVIIGWRAREAAFLLAVFALLAAFMFHLNMSDQMQMIMFLKNIAIAGGFLMIVAQGPGALSVGKN
ncbi:MAG TPA: DoxX family protein [Gammaproteobacteria bacterium]